MNAQLQLLTELEAARILILAIRERLVQQIGQEWDRRVSLQIDRIERIWELLDELDPVGEQDSGFEHISGPLHRALEDLVGRVR